jgi:Uncharacterized protein family UPF0029
MNDETNESLERALADIEMLQAAYPEEIDFDDDQVKEFPLQVTLKLGEQSSLVLNFEDGYPIKTNIKISSYRSPAKLRIDAVTRSVRLVAKDCLKDEMEGGLLCCAAAIDTWQEYQLLNQIKPPKSQITLDTDFLSHQLESSRSYTWTTGEPLMDRKSIFLAHACRVVSEVEVREALAQLLSSSSKIQRATHNMYAWRVNEVLVDGTRVLKHDNDDDGEDAAGSKLALLLAQRKEDGVVVVVSRWFGGIHLGPKRFAHILNTTRELLIHCHENVWSNTK